MIDQFELIYRHLKEKEMLEYDRIESSDILFQCAIINQFINEN